MRRVARRHETAVPGGANSAVPVSVLEHAEQIEALRVLAIDVAGGHRGVGQGGRYRGDIVFVEHGNHTAVPADHGNRIGIVQDGRDVHRAKNTPGRNGIELRLRDGGTILRGIDRVGQHGAIITGASLRAIIKARRSMLPAPGRSSPREGGVENVLTAVVTRQYLHAALAKRSDGSTLVGAIVGNRQRRNQ